MTSPSAADDKDHLKDKKHKVQGRINDAQSNLDQSSSKLKKAANALDAAQGKLTSARNTLSETRGQLAVARAKDARMQAKLVAAQAALTKAKANLKQGRKDLKKSRKQVRRFTLNRLQNGDPGLRALGDLVGGSDPMEYSEQMSLNDSVGDAQLAEMEELDASEVMLELNKEKVTKLRNEVADQREAAAENLERKQELEKSAEAQTVKVKGLVRETADAKQVAAEAKQSDLRKLNDLAAERDRIGNKLQKIAAREAAKHSNSSSGGSSGSSGGGGGGGGGGGMIYPVEGPITSPYGMRYHPVLHVNKLHDGTDFGVSCGTPVHAAASGTVIEEYFNEGYGNRIIISHGQMRGGSIATTYNHLSSFVASPGEHVGQGELIGYSGTSGYSTGCHLHFMVLKDGVTRDPMNNWL